MRSLRPTFVLLVLWLAGCGDDPADPTLDGGGTDATVVCTQDEDCDDDRFCNGVEDCAPASPSADARGCAPATVSPCVTGQTCDESARSCTTECSVTEDADGDGARAMECGGDDCDDADETRFPEATEVCDLLGHDEDCDPTTYGERDVDGDGETDALCCNGETCGRDCDDLRRGTSPDASEVCDGLDNDCDDLVDERVTVAVWPDLDFDLHGDSSATAEMRCAGAFGYATVGDDCDDDDPAVHPAQVEICDGKDNDCDALQDEAPAAVTWYADADGDGFGSSDPTLARVSCTPLPGYSLRATDCDDSRAGMSPATPERCDGLDNDCNGRPDFILGARDTEDDDGDGHADLACPGGDDCDDRDPTSAPESAEICDGRDNDCNGEIDDGSAMGSWWIDRDGDTYGDDDTEPVMSCSFVRGRIPRGGDCDDSSADRRPGAREVCDGSDDDCDELVDEGSERGAYYVDADGDGLGAGTALLACVAPSDRVDNASDCDDTNRTIGAARVFFVDADGDTWGDPLRSELSCATLSNRVTRGGDCADGDATIYPMATERCGGGDEDCDGTTDEDPAASASCTITGASGVCSAGACTIGMCAPGLGDCNTSSTDGCETSLRTDPTSCGTCGVMCGAGERCRDGECARVTSITAGDSHVCALLDTGRVACWGSNLYAQLGRGTTGSSGAPPTDASQLVSLYTGAVLEDVVEVDSHPDANFTCAVRATGQVVCWGQNHELQIGDDAPASYASRAVPIPGIGGATHVTVGARHACAIVGSGEVRCWGSNSGGQLVSGSTTPVRSGAPVTAVENEGGIQRPIPDAIAIAAANELTCVLHAGGQRVSCAGRNGSGGGATGQLGRGTLAAGIYPIADDAIFPVGTVLNGLQGGAGSYDGFMCATRAVGAPLCWGLNTYEALGPGGAIQAPRAFQPLLFAQTQGLAIGQEFLCVRYTNESFGPRVACSGLGGSGQLGNDSTSNSATPTDVISAPADGPRGFLRSDEITQLTAGRAFVCALLTNGAVTCWGQPAMIYGDGTTTARRVAIPTSVASNLP
ncbi:MopE-related protein [Sandaracinus amylolyticus]|uniref:MopE-related protein n=1 Tax=Sandaracinus amylolyticus TaxID=927083 RepID=UPI001F399726|nr:MopE-related protein [Sandaracinus amylolyticus]UJR85599.1 Hypothetical protein I5071_76790 [Sandaracinus amylolyticus]